MTLANSPRDWSRQEGNLFMAQCSHVERDNGGLDSGEFGGFLML